MALTLTSTLIWEQALAHLAAGAPGVFLDSASSQGPTARRSLIGLFPKEDIWLDSGDLSRLDPPDGHAVGYFAYELAACFEKLDLPHYAPLGRFLLFDGLLMKDHATGEVSWLGQPLDISAAPEADLAFRTGEAVADVDPQGYQAMVRQAQQYIRQGDIYQANLSVGFQAPIQGSAWGLYAKLRRINPSPFAAYLNFGDHQIVSASPERLLRKEGNQVATRPIAGTRRRGHDEAEDQALAEELLLSPKERAEHVMLVDLERNDLGRICRYGTVQVDELMVLEQYSHVTHIVSNVVGELKADLGLYDLLRALFPGGTITGAPKLRAMEIIAQLEKRPRGLYTGSIGYLTPTGDLDLNIAIRTLSVTGDTVHWHAGAGIVADSDPSREYQECLDKARALMEALNGR